MKRWFAWAPLAPPGHNSPPPPGTARRADLIALVFLGLGLLQIIFGMGEGNLRFIALGLGMLLFGLPHGAIDHLVALGLAAKPLRPAPLAIVISLYLLVVLAVLGFWMLAPPAAVLGFLIMTVWHWGKADLAFERFILPSFRSFRSRPGDLIHSLIRGMIPIGIPFIAFPDQATEFINACARVFDPGHEFAAHLWHTPVLVLLTILLATDLFLHLRHWRKPLARRVLIENTLLTAFFFLVPPLVAIGWYFAGWHGFRHILRLSSYLPQEKPESVPADQKIRATSRILRVARQAIPFTLASVLMLVALYAGLFARIPNPLQAIALYLILISALTLPHLIIVEWMDLREHRAKR